MRKEPTLICIPDISGFTRFMSDIDFELSAKVIPALLNKIIYSNEIGLKISEIEGDAVLFYKSGDLPDLQSLIDQCFHFHRQFYNQMDELLEQFRGEKDSHKIPDILGLKMILHYGEEIGMVPVGNRIKLMGEDVITAHRLLKNSIPSKEYVLLSKTLLDRYDAEEVAEFEKMDGLQEGYLEVEHLGQVPYRYLDTKSL